MCFANSNFTYILYTLKIYIKAFGNITKQSRASTDSNIHSVYMCLTNFDLTYMLYYLESIYCIKAVGNIAKSSLGHVQKSRGRLHPIFITITKSNSHIKYIYLCFTCIPPRGIESREEKDYSKCRACPKIKIISIPESNSHIRYTFVLYLYSTEEKDYSTAQYTYVHLILTFL